VSNKKVVICVFYPIENQKFEKKSVLKKVVKETWRCGG
jgi:hypothetical protein